ncbi:MAG: DUF4266 domain-containing protein [Planctomycetota bacterium]|nr:DUF4266 domain-containing protein [Planctomycetota bacterium]
MRFSRSARWFVLLPLLGLAPSCTSVEFYEREALTDVTMQFDEDPTLIHFQQKVLYSCEGAIGGVGSLAGGGCGCY